MKTSAYLVGLLVVCCQALNAQTRVVGQSGILWNEGAAAVTSDSAPQRRASVAVGQLRQLRTVRSPTPYRLGPPCTFGIAVERRLFGCNAGTVACWGTVGLPGR